jgi:putative transcriptional regulator
VLALAAAGFVSAQVEPGPELARGSLLVAQEKLGDPNFAHSVVLILDHDDNGTVGLIVNRRSGASLSDLFPRLKEASKDPIYEGGPVELTSGQALILGAQKLKDATRIVGDVYSTRDKHAIEKLIKAKVSPAQFRLYLGYAGWEPGQLEAEIRIGAWRITTAESEMIFDSNPETLWQRLRREWDQRVAVLEFRPFIYRGGFAAADDPGSVAPP